MSNRILTWLRSAPIADPVDRRNAPVMQVLLLCYGFLLPANWAWRMLVKGVPEGWATVVALDLLTAAFALACIVLIRRGRFRPAVVLFLAALLAGLEFVYLDLGAQSQLVDQLTTALVLMISGLVLGRRALWIGFAVLMVVFATGFATDIRSAIEAGESVGRALRNVPAFVIPPLLIAAILDRTVTALRESLAESESRGRELQREMAERERAQSQLIHAQKLEATGRLASGVAHDFNNILDVILGFARQRHAASDLADARESLDALAGSLDGVETAARRGTAITRKLLGFSRADLLKPQTFDLGEAVADLQPMLRQLFPPSVRLSLDTGDRPLAVHIDRSELEMMLLNIAANARDAMPGGGRFEVRVLEANGMACIALADSGHGMDARTLRHIFEPFFTTKDASTGTGLGLSVIQDLVHAVGGDIRVDSTPGAGSTFTLRLPLAGDITGPDAGSEGDSRQFA